MILVVHAHPYPTHSRATEALLSPLRALPGVEVRSLYQQYPDFDIDVAAEQRALLAAQLIVWLHPIYWYSPPALMKQWFESVLTRGWAYGNGGEALQGKSCLWVACTGGEPESYSEDGIHEQPFDNFVPVVEQTARFCGMRWEAPFILHGSHAISDAELAAAAAELSARIAGWQPPQ